MAGNRGYLDGTLEFSNWLKYIRSSDQLDLCNLRAVLAAGQVCIILVSLNCFFLFAFFIINFIILFYNL